MQDYHQYCPEGRREGSEWASNAGVAHNRAELRCADLGWHAGCELGHVCVRKVHVCSAAACRATLDGMRAQLIEPPDLAHEYPRAKVWFHFGEHDDPAGMDVVLEMESATDDHDPHNPYWYTVQVAITACIPGWSVSAQTLRLIRLGELASQATRIIAGSSTRFVDDHAEEIALAGRIGGREDRTFQLVGGVYEDELRRGGKPVQTIAEAFGVSRGTATRWVRKARDLGYISALESERSGGK